jgi:hypothetical protein
VNIFRFLTSLSTSFSLVVESWPVLDASSIIFALRFLFLLSFSHVDHTILFVPHHRNTITTNITITIIIMFSFSFLFSAPVMAPSASLQPPMLSLTHRTPQLSPSILWI